MKNLIEKYFIRESYVYSIFRIIIALIFMCHGAQKLFGAFGGLNGQGAVVPFGSLFFWAGVIELASGIAIFLGIFTRFFALIATIEMLIAYFMVHFPQGFFPIKNGGELAVLYFSSFLLITAKGAPVLSLERLVSGKEIF